MEVRKADSIADSPLIYVVIVNWNRANDTIECLRALESSDYSNYHPLIVDNGSTDGSPDAIRAAFPVVEVIANQDNLGFARASNIGIEHALQQGADYVFLLNNDTLVSERLLTELVAVGESDPKIGMLAPKIYYHGGERCPEPFDKLRTVPAKGGRLWSAGARWRRFPPRVTIIGFGREDGPAYSIQREVDYATGCAMLVKRDVFERVGVFDPAFFMYHEDYDFSARVRRGGYRIVYVPQAVMWHKVSASTGEESPLKWYYLGKYVTPFYLKHCRPPRLSLALFALWVLAREMVKGNARYLGSYIRGLRDGWREFAAKNFPPKVGGGAGGAMRVKLEEKLIFFLNKLFQRPYGSFGELMAAKTGAKANFQWEFDQAERSYSAFQPYINLKGKDVLDVGCGLGGKTLFHLLQGARRVTGLDISQTNARIAQSCFAEREPESGQRPGLVVADAAAMPFADGSFDLAISTYTFEHLADPAGVLGEIQRVVKPRGEVFISFPPYFSPWGAHLTDWIYFPWCQVLFSEKALLNVARAIDETEHIHASLPEFARIELTGAAELPHVNKLTVRDFERFLKASSLEVLCKIHRPVGLDMIRVLHPILPLATRIPVLREMFTSSVVLIGRKPV